MHEHHPEIFTFCIEKMWCNLWPVIGNREQIILPCLAVERLMGVFVPTMPDVPQPWLVPQSKQSKYYTNCIMKKTPCTLAKFAKYLRWFILCPSISPPRSVMFTCLVSSILVCWSTRLHSLYAASKIGFGTADLQRALLMPNNTPSGVKIYFSAQYFVVFCGEYRDRRR